MTYASRLRHRLISPQCDAAFYQRSTPPESQTAFYILKLNIFKMADTHNTSLEQWALPELGHLLPLSEDELKQIINYVEPKSDPETEAHLQELLGDSPEVAQFTVQFVERRQFLRASARKQMSDEKSSLAMSPAGANSNDATNASTGHQPSQDIKGNPPAYLPPAGPPPANAAGRAAARHHTNQVIEASKVRARDEVRWSL